MVGAVGAELLELPALDAIEAAGRRRRGEQRRNRLPIGREPLGEPLGAHPIDELERSQLPAVAGAHRLVDLVDLLGNGRHERRGVRERLRQHAPGVTSAAVGVLEERAQIRALRAGPLPAFVGRVEARELRLLLRTVLARPQVDRLERLAGR